MQWLVSPEDVVLLMLKSVAGLMAPHRLHDLAPTVGAGTCAKESALIVTDLSPTFEVW